jgi:hypothetical protein
MIKNENKLNSNLHCTTTQILEIEGEVKDVLCNSLRQKENYLSEWKGNLESEEKRWPKFYVNFY